MQDQPTRTLAASQYEVIANRFPLLAIAPTATNSQVEQAFATARERAAAPEEALAEARDSILDPAQRLLCELTCPLDSTAREIAAFNQGLSGSAAMSELLPAAKAWPPLSRANFLACLAARQPADANLLIALVEAHAAIETTTIFEILRGCRSRSGFPTPSLLNTGQGLQELLALHSDAVMAGFGEARSATRAFSSEVDTGSRQENASNQESRAPFRFHRNGKSSGPFLGCVSQILSSDSRYRVEALSGLLGAYRKSLDALNPSASHDIEAACTAIQQRPDDDAVFRQFETALVGHVSAIAPLALFDFHQKRRNDEIDKIAARTRVLLADLIGRGDHKTARKIITPCLDAFRLLPGFIEPFEEAAMALPELELEAEIEPLAALIQNFDREPALLAADIQGRGFGKESSGQARALWQAFAAAVAATSQTALHERPWMLARDFVFRLDTRPEFAKAATRMMADLLLAGETLPATPAILDILRHDLRELEARNGPATASGSRATSYLKMALFIIFVPVLIFAAFLTYQYLNARTPLAASAPQSDAKPNPEAIPPAGKGERFKLDFVRYCHFQEERLRVIKQHVRGPEDIQAFNMLANDYNSRCSNFYYLDEDLRSVTEEVKAKKQMLEADAMRILSTWPWHATSDNTSPPAVK